MPGFIVNLVSFSISIGFVGVIPDPIKLSSSASRPNSVFEPASISGFVVL